MNIVNKPWGHEEIWAVTKNYVGKFLHIKKGHRLSRQFHEVKEETIRVLNGTLVLEIGIADSLVRNTMMVGESYTIVPGTIHRFCAEESDVVLVEVSTNHLEDVVRLEDDYKR